MNPLLPTRREALQIGMGMFGLTLPGYPGSAREKLVEQVGGNDLGVRSELPWFVSHPEVVPTTSVDLTASPAVLHR